MTEAPLPTAATLREEMVKIDSLIATARRLLDEGRIVDLKALEDRTRFVCESALQLPAAEAKPLAPALEALMTALDNLTAALTARFGDLPQLEMPTHADAATAAYGQALKHFVS